MSVYAYMEKLANAGEAGEAAYYDGKKESDCPYRSDSDEAICWHDGFSLARELDNGSN